MYAAALQACELSHGALDKISGKFVEGDIYELDEREVAEFDKQFPEKGKMPRADTGQIRRSFENDT